MAAVSRLSLEAIPRAPYGTCSGKTPYAAPVVVPDTENFTTPEMVADALAEILRERLDKWKQDHDGLRDLPSIRHWEAIEQDEAPDFATLPAGYVAFNTWDSVRDPQDGGAGMEYVFDVYVYTNREQHGTDAHTLAIRYGDAVMLTVNKEAKVTRPKDATVLPGLFRAWATEMEPVFGGDGEYGAHVTVRVPVDWEEGLAV